MAESVERAFLNRLDKMDKCLQHSGRKKPPVGHKYMSFYIGMCYKAVHKITRLDFFV